MKQKFKQLYLHIWIHLVILEMYVHYNHVAIIHRFGEELTGIMPMSVYMIPSEYKC